MERLTRRYDTHVAVVCENCHKPGHCLNAEDCNEVLRKRLAAYEDTGLEPEEVAELISPEAVEIARLLEQMFKEGSAQHMRDLLQAEKDGRLVVLPCKPGGMVQFKGNPADKSKVDAITIYADGSMTFLFHDYGVKETFVDEWSEDEAEKYMPCEEAEAALEGGKDHA